MTQEQIQQTAETVYKQHMEPDEFWYPNKAVVELQRKAFIHGTELHQPKWISIEQDKRLSQVKNHEDFFIKYEDGTVRRFFEKPLKKIVIHYMPFPEK